MWSCRTWNNTRLDVKHSQTSTTLFWRWWLQISYWFEMIISISLLRVSLLWTNCDYFSSTAFGAKGQIQKINTDPQELFLASCCSLRMSGLAECCMLWWDWGSPIAQGLQVWRASDSLRCVKVCLGRIGFCTSTHASLRVCAQWSARPHMLGECVHFAATDQCVVFCLFFFFVFFWQDSQTPAAKI